MDEEQMVDTVIKQMVDHWFDPKTQQQLIEGSMGNIAIIACKAMNMDIKAVPHALLWEPHLSFTHFQMYMSSWFSSEERSQTLVRAFCDAYLTLIVSVPPLNHLIHATVNLQTILRVYVSQYILTAENPSKATGTLLKISVASIKYNPVFQYRTEGRLSLMTFVIISLLRECENFTIAQKFSTMLAYLLEKFVFEWPRADIEEIIPAGDLRQEQIMLSLKLPDRQRLVGLQNLVSASRALCNTMQFRPVINNVIL